MVVDPLVLLSQVGDGIAEGKETQVGVDPLLQPLPPRVGPLCCRSWPGPLSETAC